MVGLNCLIILISFGSALSFKSIRPVTQTSVLYSIRGGARKSGFEKFVDKLFDDADADNSGSISLPETYELVLQLYVNINRQAPIPPPSREKVYELFLENDKNQNNQISRDEFTHLAVVLGRRALVRLIAHKLVTLIGAPLLAGFVVNQLSGVAWIQEFGEKYLPSQVQPFFSTPSNMKMVLLVIFVATLGNLVLSIVNWLLDMHRKKTTTDETSKQK